MDDPVIDPAMVRQRLLDAADELFYHEGLHRVHIDRVIEKAGVPVETLRDAFGSTDELIRTYLRPVTPGCRTPSPENCLGTTHLESVWWVSSRSKGSRSSSQVSTGARW
ncbi:MAG: hypothetical protein QOK12_1110 [Mycobacterium sp.]|jgi:hypothetical protein|nr:hypothetical protein [Mycobacterium sp.]